MTKRAWHRLATVAKVGISVAIMWFLIEKYDFGGFLDRLADVDPTWLGVAGLIFSALILLSALRWQVILNALGQGVRLRPLTGLVMIGLFFNQVLPSNLGGDAMRIWRLHRLGSSVARAVGSVMLDRVFALAALASLVLITLPMAFALIDDPLIRFGFWVFLGSVAFGVCLLLWLDRIVLIFRRALPGKFVEGVVSLAQDARHVFLQARYFWLILAMAIAGQIFIVLLTMSLALGLGLPANFADYIVLVPPILLASVLPLSFAGWGVREVMMVAMLGTIGIAEIDALAVSVTFGLVGLAGSLPGGVVWLLTGNRHTKYATAADSTGNDRPAR